MGLGISFTAARKNAGNQLTQPELQETLIALSSHFDYQIYGYENNYRLVFCPMAEMNITYKLTAISGSTNTTAAGPGFHGEVVRFIEELGNTLQLTLKVEDETPYWDKRDFTLLQKEHIAWLQRLLNIVNAPDTAQSFIVWPIDEYWRPASEAHVISPMGSFDRYYLNTIIQEEKITAFAKDFFIWFNKEKDAYYYRNHALYLMWNECRWIVPETEDEVALIKQIISYVDKAHELDNNIQLPEQEMKELEQLLEGISIKPNTKVIGYRRHNIVISFNGGWEVIIPGCFAEEEEENGKVYWYRNRTLRLTYYQLKEGIGIDEASDFLANNKKKGEFYIIDQQHEHSYKARYWFSEQEDGDYWILSGEIMKANKLAVVTITWEEEEDKEWAIATFKSIKTN